MEENHYRNLVQRYLQKKSTDEELETFVYLMKQGKLDKYLEEAMDADLGIEPAEDLSLIKTRKFNPFRWPVAAAVILAAGFLFFFSLKKKQPVDVITDKIVQNTSLSIMKRTLPDGSTIWLNPGSKLTYPSKFGKYRAVSMQGEIFFEVVKDHRHPFVISSGTVTTKVWGTSFRIRSFPDGKDAMVSVLTGKVSVSASVKDTKEVMLLPEEEVTYRKTDRRLLKARIREKSDMMLWRKAKLSFENAELSVIVPELSRYYHIPIVLEGTQLQKYKLTADFRDKNLPDILLLICKSLQCSYTSTGKEIRIQTTSQQFNHL